MASLSPIQESKRRPDGPQWIVRSTVGPESTHKAKRDALHAYRWAMVAEEFSVKPEMTFTELADARFRPAYETTVETSTLGNLNQHLQPLLTEFEGETLRDITTQRCELARARMAPGEPRKRRMSLLNRILQWGVEQNLLPYHPGTLMEPLTSEFVVQEAAYLRMPTAPDLRHILSNTVPGMIEDYVYTLLFGLMRPGEAQVFEFGDYSRQTGELSINKTADYDKGTKTLDSNRFVLAPKQLKDHLDRRIALIRPRPDQTIIVMPNGEKPNSEYLRTRFYEFQVSIGIGVKVRDQVYRGVFTPNQFRHAGTALLIWARCPARQIAAYLCHSTPHLVQKTYGYLIHHKKAGDLVWPVGDVVNDSI
jgi:integrase